MKVLFSIHLYPPKHNCGAEYMAHHIAKHLISQGHTVKVLLLQANHYRIEQMYEHEGVMVFPPTEAAITDTLFRDADVVFTHLDYTHWTIQMAKAYGKPVVHLIHNTHKYEAIISADRPQYIVYNSNWAKSELGYKWDSIVMYPPCDYRIYDTGLDSSKNQFITLINMDQNKGGHILKAIAEAMPDKKFLGVMGSYSEPAKVGQITDQPGNVMVLPNSPDIMKAYRNTRILIMPSKYESWGRTATEAMASGIPVISSGTPGLRENCGEAGIYIEDRDDIKAWVKAIKKLDDPKEYKKCSEKARKRAKELDPMEDLIRLETWLRQITGSL
jgi:glycosyltransferase involved in cell wall biosynthesis